MALLHSFVDYRRWSLLSTLMALFCLPVDVLIFYKEPVGIWGTLLAPISFIPFGVMCADAMFPDKEVLVRGLGSMIIAIQHSWQIYAHACRLLKQHLFKQSVCRQIFYILDGKIRRIIKNSWSNHLNLTYNKKYFYGMNRKCELLFLDI